MLNYVAEDFCLRKEGNFWKQNMSYFNRLNKQH